MAEISVFEELIGPRVLQIIRVLIKNKKSLFHLHKLSSQSKIPIATLSRMLPKLVKINIIKQIQIGKLKLYQAAENRKTRELEKLIRR